MIFIAVKHQVRNYGREGGVRPVCQNFCPPCKIRIRLLYLLLYFIANDALLDIMQGQPLCAGDLDYICILTSNQIFIILVLVPVKMWRVGGADRRNLRQNTVQLCISGKSMATSVNFTDSGFNPIRPASKV